MSSFTPAVDFALNLNKDHGHAGILDAERFDDHFDDAMAFTGPQEGGEVNDPDDPGGHTNYGVTQTTYDRWQRSKGITTPRSVSQITVNEVLMIYDELYWDPGHCNELPGPVAIVHFDACVNLGVAGAIAVLQRACGLKDDGIWGPVTAHVVSTEATPTLIENLCWERLATYSAKVAAKPIKLKFFRGWVNRVVALRRYAQGQV